MKNRNKIRLEARRMSAADRNEFHASLTPQQKLDLLDARLGKGVGAVKERAKLQKALEAGAKPPPREKAAKVFKK